MFYTFDTHFSSSSAASPEILIASKTLMLSCMGTTVRLYREDIHRATLEMKERSLRVGKLQNKFEVLVARVKHDKDSEDGGEHSQAYYVIKAAQQREDMQRQ
jgi:hypothetical protein